MLMKASFVIQLTNLLELDLEIFLFLVIFLFYFFQDFQVGLGKWVVD